MTGLELDKVLVEVACVITEADLTKVADFGPIVIHQNEETLEKMNPWCKRTFKKNGLLELIKESQYSEETVDNMLKEFLNKNTPENKCPLAGNSVGMDRMFINKYLPQTAGHIHYRTVDVSTIKELCRRWHPDIYEKAPDKKMNHRSLDDVYESIDELKYYRQSLF
ncbi:UNVERIFIED_CONTAM: Oligoribonuclease, mitochondrial, partial [Eudyptes robustus]